VIILAIDPGVTGALAWVTSDGILIDAVDVPIIVVRGKKKISAAGLVTLMKTRSVSCVVIEGVASRPKQGVASMFNFGYSAGLLEGAATALGFPVQIIPAATWKAGAGVSKDKGVARMMATRFWPGAADKFALVKNDGRAEAALLARWVALKKS